MPSSPIFRKMPTTKDLFALCFLLNSALLPAEELRAPQPNIHTVSQQLVSGNACGTAALMNSYRSGSSNWQNLLQRLPATSDKERLKYLVYHYGMKQSGHKPLGLARWTKRGISVADLLDISHEVSQQQPVPKLKEKLFFASKGETPAKLLERAHSQLSKSMQKGFPPILSLRRYSLRNQPSGGTPNWVILDAHFVTLISLPKTLSPTETSFSVEYIDPWLGKTHRGQIAIPQLALLAAAGQPSPCLEAIFPSSPVGKSLLKANEPTAIVLTASIGDFGVF